MGSARLGMNRGNLGSRSARALTPAHMDPPTTPTRRLIGQEIEDSDLIGGLSRPLQSLFFPALIPLK